MMLPEHNIRGEVLKDLINYLRMMELKHGEKPMKSETIIAEMPSKGSEEEPFEDPFEEKSEEPMDDDQPLTEVQEKMRDFFNNRRPKTGSSMKKGRALINDVKPNREMPVMKGKKGK